MNVIPLISQINTEFIGFLEVHHEIERTLPKVSGLKFIYPREPVFFKMSEKVRECIQDNTKRQQKLKTFTQKLKYFDNFLQFTAIIETILLNFALLERYINRMKIDYRKIKGRLAESSNLTMADFARIEIDKFLKYVPNIQKIYDAYEIFLRQENQKRTENNNQMEFLQTAEKYKELYNNIAVEYVKIKMPEIPNILDWIKIDAYQEVAIFQQNKMIKDMYCAVINTNNQELHNKFKKFLEDNSIINPRNTSRYQNYPQYLLQFPFNTTETKIYSFKEIVEKLTDDTNLNFTDLNTTIRRVEERLGMKFIIINSQPTAKYVDIQDQHAKSLFEEQVAIRKKLQSLAREKPLTTIKTSIYEIQDERASLEKRLSELREESGSIAEKSIKIIKAGPTPDQIKRPLILVPSTPAELFNTDPLLFRNLSSSDKDPAYYIVLFSLVEDQFQYIGKYNTFADIPFSTGLFRLISDGRYNVSELGFTIPSEKYSESVRKRQEIIDKLNAVQRGMQGLITLFHRDSRTIEIPMPDLVLKPLDDMKQRIASSRNATSNYLSTHQKNLEEIESSYKKLTAVEKFPWEVKDQFKKIEQRFLLNIALTKSDLRNKFLTELEKMNLKIQVFNQEILDFLILQKYNLILQDRNTDKITELINAI